MPNFRFQAMNSAGDKCEEQIEAATADEARQLLAAWLICVAADRGAQQCR